MIQTAAIPYLLRVVCPQAMRSYSKKERVDGSREQTGVLRIR